MNVNVCRQQKLLRSLCSLASDAMFWGILCSLLALNVALVSCDEEAFYWQPSLYPSLGQDNDQPSHGKSCIADSSRNSSTSICDPDMILSAYEAQLLDNLLDTDLNQTACICDPCPPNRKGLEIRVALLTFFKLAVNQSQETAAKQFADEVRVRWNYDMGCEHDVLVLVSTYNSVHISMGELAARVVDVDQAKEIVQQTMKYFTYGKTYQGLEAIIASLQYRAQLYDPRMDRFSLKQGLMIAAIGAIVSLVLLALLVRFCINKEERRLKKLNGTELAYTAVSNKS